MGWIYKVTNQINGKMYIGKTEHINPYDRWKEHLRDYKKPRYGKRPFYDAISKYGEDNFLFEIIGEFENGNLLSEKEKEYILKYRTYVNFPDSNGYNATLGGDGKSYLNLDIDKVIDYYFSTGMNVTKTADYFNVCSDSIYKILNRNNVLSLSVAETSDKRYVTRYGGLVMLDYNGYMVIDVLKSPREFAEKYGFDPQNITKALTRDSGYKTGKSQGYLWYRLNELPSKYYDSLDDFYSRNVIDFDEDNIEIDDTMLDLAM